ncbi:MAG: hypothetical protein QXV27_05645 [Candidatus Caldarchaeum sp.]
MDVDACDRLLEEVFALHPNVRYAEIFDSAANHVAGGMRPGFESLDPPEVSSRVDVETAKYALLLIQNRKYYGDLEYIYASMKGINVLILPFMSGVLVTAFNPPTGLGILPALTKIIERYLK